MKRPDIQWHFRVSRLVSVCASVFASVLLVTAISSAPSAAQTAEGQSRLSVAPAIIDNTVDRGASFSAEITVTNGTARPMAFHSSKEAFQPEQTVDSAHSGIYDVSSWIDVAETDFLLMGGGAKTVHVGIKVPANAEPGSHYSAIYFEAFVPGQVDTGASTLINGRVGVIVVLTVTGDIRARASAVGPVKAPGLQGEAGPTPLAFVLSNDGNIHLEPRGNIRVRNIFGRTVKTIPLVGGRVEGAGPTLLPGTDRKYDVSWEHGLRFGIYRADASVSLTGLQQEIHIGSSTFVLLPMIIVVPLLTIVLLVSAVVVVLRIRRSRRSRVWAETIAKLSSPSESHDGDTSDSQAVAEADDETQQHHSTGDGDGQPAEPKSDA